MLLLAQALLVPLAFAVEPLSRAEQIRTLARAEAARALPVKLSGVVIYKGWNNLVIHDGEAAVYLDFVNSKKQGVWQGPLPNLDKMIPGTGLDVEGVTDPGGFSPMILVKKLRRTRSLPIPDPIRPMIEDLLSSAHDSQWVEVEGVVRKLENSPDKQQCLTLLVGGHPCPVLFHNRLRLSRDKLVDSRIRVRGVLLNIANLRSQTAGIKIHSNGTRDVDVIVPPPIDPFLAPKVSLDKLISFRPDADLGHRRASSGVVTFAVPGRFFYLMDRGSHVRVDSEETRISSGDMVEVSGFIDTSRILASFSEALVRKTGIGKVPLPAEPLISEILSPRMRSVEEMVLEQGYPDFDGRLVRLRGEVRRVNPQDMDGISTVVVEFGEHLVQAFLPAEAPEYAPGSVVELTGVCELEMERLDERPWFSITGFHLWLSSSDGFRLISEPPWWTPGRLGLLLSAVILVLVLVLVWGYAMRRRVAVKGAQLAAEIAARESAQLEFDTVLRERRRLANDLHDTLEQALTGLALQLEIAIRSRSSDPAMSERHMNLARLFLERSRSEAHRTVWDLRTNGQAGRDFLEILRERVSSMIEGSGIAIKFRREGDPAPMEDLIAGNLLLLAQEAVTNALKHSGASEIDIFLRHSPVQVSLVIEDNGCGFDTDAVPDHQSGHFGLQVMRERTKRLGGLIELETAPGQGTAYRVTVPLPVAESHEPA